MTNIPKKKLKNHIVQDKYLAQWYRNGEEFFSLYLIKENSIKDRVNTDWRGFWRKGFNVLDGEIFSDDDYNFPEEFTNKVDSPGISVVRLLDTKNKKHLDGKDLSTLSLYIALQYFRTPRFRDELNSMKDLVVKELYEEKEKKFLSTDDFVVKKQMELILRVEEFAKKVFNFRWIFLLAPKETSFITSDSPCFVIDNNESNVDKGFLSHNANVIFPLRPDVCLMINNDKNQGQFFFELDKQTVRGINKIIIENTYSAVVATDKNHLAYLTKNLDYQNHKPHRKATVQKFGDYIKIGLS